MRRQTDENSIKITKETDGYLIEGAIDENAQFDSIEPQAGAVRLDLRGIESISSIGIRRWVRFMEKCAPHRIKLVACPPPLVSVMNAVPAAVGRGPASESVVSVLIPYACKGCNFYHEVEVAVTELVRGTSLEVPDHLCSSCGSPTRIVAEIDEYLYFLIAND